MLEPSVTTVLSYTVRSLLFLSPLKWRASGSSLEQSLHHSDRSCAFSSIYGSSSRRYYRCFFFFCFSPLHAVLGQSFMPISTYFQQRPYILRTASSHSAALMRTTLDCDQTSYRRVSHSSFDQSQYRQSWYGRTLWAVFSSFSLRLLVSR